jgi:hypothetical protein
MLIIMAFEKVYRTGSASATGKKYIVNVVDAMKSSS